MAKRNSKKATTTSVAVTPPAVKPALNGEKSGATGSAPQRVAVPASVTDARLTPVVQAPPASIVSQRPETATVVMKAPAASVKVTFMLYEPDAKEIWLCGDFNAWASGSTPMKRQPGGAWTAALDLVPGRYEYKFVVDGHWIPDPLARENIWNLHGTLNSVVQVRG